MDIFTTFKLLFFLILPLNLAPLVGADDIGNYCQFSYWNVGTDELAYVCKSSRGPRYLKTYQLNECVGDIDGQLAVILHSIYERLVWSAAKPLLLPVQLKVS
jgi:hypothetical protein